VEARIFWIGVILFPPTAGRGAAGTEADTVGAAESTTTTLGTGRRAVLGKTSGVATITIAVSNNARKKRLSIVEWPCEHVAQGTGSYPPERKG
jgi:hypothetical protein